MDRPILAEEGQYVVAYIIGSGKALVFRVKSRSNIGDEFFHYGPIPYTSGQALSTYDGSSTTAPAAGVIPSRGYNSSGQQFTPPSSIAQQIFDSTDLWYTDESYRERLFHVIQKVTPAFLRIDVEIPTGVIQTRFQRDKVVTGIQTTQPPLGFTRGVLDIIQIPRLHYGYRWGNDTNINLMTSVDFTYAEYVVEIPHDPNLIFLILTKRIPSVWISLPIMSVTGDVENALKLDYGFDGFPVYRTDQQKQAIDAYNAIMPKLLL
jgi:hypothetical protein